MVQARPALGQELADRGLRSQRREQLEVPIPDVEERRVYALGLDRLAMHERHPERVAVEREGRVDVLDGDPDMVDSSEHWAPGYASRGAGRQNGAGGAVGAAP